MIQQYSIRILSVDHHPLFREGIATVIENQPDMLLVAEAASGAQELQRFHEHQPDVTLMDLRLPDSSGIEAMIAIRRQFAEARVILLSSFEGDVDVQRALEAGAWGYVLKSTDPREIVGMIRQVYSGKKSIPLPIAAHLADGANPTEVVGKDSNTG